MWFPRKASTDAARSGPLPHDSFKAADSAPAADEAAPIPAVRHRRWWRGRVDLAGFPWLGLAAYFGGIAVVAAVGAWAFAHVVPAALRQMPPGLIAAHNEPRAPATTEGRGSALAAPAPAAAGPAAVPPVAPAAAAPAIAAPAAAQQQASAPPSPPPAAEPVKERRKKHSRKKRRN